MQERETDTIQVLLRAQLILRGAISIFEENSPEICRILITAEKDSLYYSLDLLSEALYTLQSNLEAEWLALREA